MGVNISVFIYFKRYQAYKMKHISLSNVLFCSSLHFSLKTDNRAQVFILANTVQWNGSFCSEIS